VNRERWRLVLGDASAGALGELDGAAAEQNAALEWLYHRDPSRRAHGIREGQSSSVQPRSRPEVTVRREAGKGSSPVTAVDWLDDIHRLFPKETVQRLERDAVERYEITEVITDPVALARIEPSASLLRAVLRTKHLMAPHVLELARNAVDKVVRELIEKLSVDVRQSFHGTRNRRRTVHRTASNFDFAATVRANLKHWSSETERITIQRPLFTSRTRRHLDVWTLILLVDQSGSMVDSVIHSAVTAACFWNIPGLRTHLVAYDTEVVDLTSEVLDPVELLMGVQLGGGTDGTRAVDYAAQLIDTPRRTIVAVISDLYEGGNADRFVRSITRLTDDGVRVLALAALDESGEPNYDREIGRRLSRAGVHVGAMTPAGLAEFVAECIR